MRLRWPGSRARSVAIHHLRRYDAHIVAVLKQWVRRPVVRPPAVESFVPGNRVRLITNGDVAFARMLDAIGAAERSVWLEMYWFAADGIGRKFFSALDAAARRGVEVRVLYDDLGSFGTPTRYFDGLRQAGAAVLAYNPLSPLERRFRLAKLSRRDHRKVLIVDHRVAYTGGLNIGDEWCDNEERPGWRDEVVELQGPVIDQLSEAFIDSWSEQAEPDSPLRLLQAATSNEGKSERQGVPIAVLTQSGYRQRRQAVRAYVHRLRHARQRVFLANAYFVPTRTIVRNLAEAARRGIDVRIILAGESDIPLVRLASRAVWARLMKAGVRLFEWQGCILHSKLAVIDGEWVTVGSFNLDYVSLLNRELNVAILDESFGGEVEREFEQALLRCVEVDYTTFKQRSIGARLLERLAYAFRAWM